MTAKFIITKQITKRETNSFQFYLKEIAKIEQFKDSDEELICAKKVIQGDKKAFEELINRNLRFVISVAKHYQNSNNHIEDLVNEGNLGLVHAATKFNPDKGFKFITYAVWWIRKYVREFVTQDNKLIRLPFNRVEDLSKINKRIEQLEQKLGRDIEVHELLNYYDKNSLSNEEMRILENIHEINIISLDKTISDDGDLTLHDILNDKNEKPSDFLLYKNLSKDKFKSLMNLLNKDEKIVVNKLYGFNGEYEKNFSEIGKEMGVSREWIRILSNNALKKLKNKIDEYELTF